VHDPVAVCIGVEFAAFQLESTQIHDAANVDRRPYKPRVVDARGFFIGASRVKAKLEFDRPILHKGRTYRDFVR
jgi:hypothetical protein